MNKIATCKETQPDKVEIKYLHCPPERRDACPVWKAGYDIPTFKDELPEHNEGCLYRRYLGPTAIALYSFTRADWQKWVEVSQKEHYYCPLRDFIVAAVEKGEVEGFIEDGTPYRWVERGERHD